MSEISKGMSESPFDGTSCSRVVFDFWVGEWFWLSLPLRVALATLAFFGVCVWLITLEEVVNDKEIQKVEDMEV